MTLEGFTLAATAAIAGTPIVFAAYRMRSRVLFLAALFAMLMVCAGLAWSAILRRTDTKTQQTISHRPIDVRSDQYVSSRTCRACHPHEYATWHKSYHRTMTQLAHGDSVVGRFDGVRLESDGREYLLQRKGDEFWVDAKYDSAPSEADLQTGETPSAVDQTGHAPDSRKQIVMTTGSHHQQIYWYPTLDSRKLDHLPFVYLIDEQRWVPHHAIFLRPPEDKPTKQPGLWNMSCSRCHTTHIRPGRDQHDNMDTQVAEFGIACEACHGPAEQHVRKNRDPRRRYWLHRTDQVDPTISHPGRLPHRLSTYVCAQCHSVNQFYTEGDEQHWAQHGYRFRPGDDLSDSRMLIRYDLDPQQPRLRGLLHYYPQYMEDYFWSDGMVRVSGREYNGLSETPCFQRGEMSCLSCHAMHKPPGDPRELADWANDQLKLGMDGNEACLQCHQRLRDNLPEHTHHLAESSGSLCYNCHMPYTSYGLLKATRSHQVDSPRVAATLKTGRPNACNLCHLDRTLQWTAEHLSHWYGQPQPWLTDDEQAVAASLLWLLRGDAGQRALTAWSMHWPPAREASGASWLAPFLAQLLDDPYDAVRFIAFRSLRDLPGYGDFAYDYVGPAQDRSQAVDLAVELWTQRAGDRRSPTGSRILMDADGQLQQDRLRRLHRQRDDRRVNLNE